MICLLTYTIFACNCFEMKPYAIVYISNINKMDVVVKIIYLNKQCLVLVSGLQEACAIVWPAAGHETIDHYDVKCNEVQPCDGYDVIKLEVSSLSGVGISCDG